MLTESFALESYPEPGTRATRTISSRLRDCFRPSECGRKRLFVICAVIFLVAFGVRFLSWQDNRRDVWRVETFVTAGYKESAHKLLHGELRAFVSDLDDMAHPPGYSILLAGIFKVFGESDSAIEFVQILCDSLAAVFVFLISGELMSGRIAYWAAILIAPITIKNAIVFHRFIPLSLGAGQKLLEGIAEYDQGRFGIPKTDLGIMRQEALMYQRPDYAMVLFGPDGIERDRLRIRRGLSVVGAHPVWYGGVMFRRAISFFKLARVPITNPEGPVSHSLDVTNIAPAWT